MAGSCCLAEEVFPLSVDLSAWQTNIRISNCDVNLNHERCVRLTLTAAMCFIYGHSLQFPSLHWEICEKEPYHRLLILIDLLCDIVDLRQTSKSFVYESVFSFARATLTLSLPIHHCLSSAAATQVHSGIWGFGNNTINLIKATAYLVQSLKLGEEALGIHQPLWSGYIISRLSRIRSSFKHIWACACILGWLEASCMATAP